MANQWGLFDCLEMVIYAIWQKVKFLILTYRPN